MSVCGGENEFDGDSRSHWDLPQLQMGCLSCPARTKLLSFREQARCSSEVTSTATVPGSRWRLHTVIPIVQCIPIQPRAPSLLMPQTPKGPSFLPRCSFEFFIYRVNEGREARLLVDGFLPV